MSIRFIFMDVDSRDDVSEVHIASIFRKLMLNSSLRYNFST
jgi:hypothetical protein